MSITTDIIKGTAKGGDLQSQQHQEKQHLKLSI